MKTFTCAFIRTITYAYYIFGIVGFLWLFFSWIDVILHNTTTCIYQDWNAFTMLLEAIKPYY